MVTSVFVGLEEVVHEAAGKIKFPAIGKTIDYSEDAKDRIAYALDGGVRLVDSKRRIEGKPFDFVTSHSEKDFLKIYKGFVHRFTTDEDLAKLFRGMKHVLKEYGNFENLYLCGVEKFVDEMNLSQKSYLVPSPADGSACKRLNLFFRWMVRNDEVDPGGWTKADAADLVVPLDTHAFKAAKILGFTEKKAPNYKAALEITSHYAEIAPEDPVKYDFALTRFGIRDDMTFDDFRREVKDYLKVH